MTKTLFLLVLFSAAIAKGGVALVSAMDLNLEPKLCSNFEFQEKLLERTMRTSHESHVMGETLNKEMKEIKTHINEKLHELQQKVESLEKRTQRDEQGMCPDRWVSFKGSCYYFDTQTINFRAATRFCESMSSYLIEITTSEEDIFIGSLLRKVRGDKFWIGLSDQERENDWVLAGSLVKADYLNWGQSQPNNGRVSNCGAIWKSFNYMWVDEPCTNRFQPVCEKPVTIPE